MLQMASLVERVAEQMQLLMQDRGVLLKREVVLMELLMGHVPAVGN